MANDYYITEFGEGQQQEQELQEYELWLYEMEAIDEINKELNCEKHSNRIY